MSSQQLTQSENQPGMYVQLLNRAILPAGDWLSGQRMMSWLDYLREAQWWDRERLHQARDERLRELATVIYQDVPFYRQLMDDAGVTPSDIRTAADLPRLPVVTKAMYRAAAMPQRTRDTGLKTFKKCSSGSTGEPFCVLGDSVTDGYTRAFTMLNFEWAGWQAGIPFMQSGINTPRSLFRQAKDTLMRCHYVSAYHLQDEQLDATLDAIDRKGIRFIMGYPSGIYWLAKRAEEVGWNQPMQGVVTWGDMLYPHYREQIERAFRARVIDKYGIGEGIEVAAQTQESDLFLINTLDVIVEFTDDDGQPVATGEPGNILLTRLHPGPHPLVRYKVGDVGFSAGGELSPCGRGLDTMRGLRGRDSDVVITPGGNRLIVHFFTGILEYFPQIDQFQVVQQKPDEILLKVIPAAGYSTEVADEVIRQLQTSGADIGIQIEETATIPLTRSGKRRFVINEVKQANQAKPDDANER